MMMITKHFVFVHMLKTGGTWLKALCNKHLPPDWIVPNKLHGHSSLQSLPAEYAGLPAFALVRNPWDWYVSYYHFKLQYQLQPHRRGDPVWTWVFDSGRTDFRQTARNACLGLTASSQPPPWWLQGIRTSDRDLYSLWYWRLIGRDAAAGQIEVGRFENLREDFIGFLQRHRIPVDEAFVSRARLEPAKNTTERGEYRDYYDDELRELVAHKARHIIETYGYEF